MAGVHLDPVEQGKLEVLGVVVYESSAACQPLDCVRELMKRCESPCQSAWLTHYHTTYVLTN